MSTLNTFSLKPFFFSLFGEYAGETLKIASFLVVHTFILADPTCCIKGITLTLGQVSPCHSCWHWTRTLQSHSTAAFKSWGSAYMKWIPNSMGTSASQFTFCLQMVPSSLEDASNPVNLAHSLSGPSCSTFFSFQRFLKNYGTQVKSLRKLYRSKAYIIFNIILAGFKFFLRRQKHICAHIIMSIAFSPYILINKKAKL